MRYTVLTNFEDYESSIFCNELGIITLVLKPTYLKNISLRNNFLKKRGRTIFNTKVCTLYKKNNNEILYKYTNHKPSLNNFTPQFVESYIHNIPTCYSYKYFSFNKKISKIYYEYKKNQSIKMYNKYFLNRFE